MLEWTGVSTSKYNLNGQLVDVKILHKFIPYSGEKLIAPIENKDIDHLAYKLLGTELESLNLMEINAVKLREYNFEMFKLQNIMIPL